MNFKAPPPPPSDEFDDVQSGILTWVDATIAARQRVW